MIVLAEPYRNFKQKIRIVQEHLEKGNKVEIFDNFVYVEVWEDGTANN